VVEIEAKVRIDDPAEVESRVARLAAFKQNRIAEDIYFAPAHVPPDEVDPGRHLVFRVRTIDGRHELTAKRKHLVDGIEVSQEVNCPITEVAAFREFAAAIGFRPFVTKRKESRIYARGELTYELNLVAGLGWFLEIECLLEGNAADLERRAAGLVESAFQELGFRREQFEPRLYIDLLRRRDRDPAR